MAGFLSYFFGKSPKFGFDQKSGEFLAYYKDTPEVVSRGKTKKEAKINLERDLKICESLQTKLEKKTQERYSGKPAYQ